MAVTIKDGASGNVAKVDSDSWLSVRAVTQTEIEHVSETVGGAYSWSNVTYDMTAADTILLVKNTSDKDLHIEEVYLGSDVTTEVQIHVPTTVVTTPAGTAVTGVNLNKGSSNVAEADAKGDETNNTQGDIVAHVIILANTMNRVNFGGTLILPKNESVGVDYVANTGAAYVTIIGHYED